MPYECVVSEIGLIGLTEPALPAVAATPSGSLAYQVREYLQAFIAPDRRPFRPGVSLREPETLARGREAEGHRSMAGCAGAEPVCDPVRRSTAVSMSIALGVAEPRETERVAVGVPRPCSS